MASSIQNRPLAVVTGASSGIGLELARYAAEKGYDLVIAADEPEIATVAEELARKVRVDAVEADLATEDGVDTLVAAVEATNRHVDVLVANAGRGLGHAFVDQDWPEIRRVIDTNVTGTVYLLHRIGRRMAHRGEGRILVVGSIAGFIPGAFQAVYNGSKAFLDNFAFAIRNELQDHGVSVTCLMPGPTETEFFERADLLDTKVGQSKKDDPKDVARLGFEAMLDGEGDIVSGWSNKLQTVMANVTPAGMLAAQHRKQAAPGTGSAGTS